MAKNKRRKLQRRPAEQPPAGERARDNDLYNQQEQQQAVEFEDFRGTPGSSLGPDNDSAIDEASAESFPASDPPAWTRNGI